MTCQLCLSRKWKERGSIATEHELGGEPGQAGVQEGPAGVTSSQDGGSPAPGPQRQEARNGGAQGCPEPVLTAAVSSTVPVPVPVPPRHGHVPSKPGNTTFPPWSHSLFTALMLLRHGYCEARLCRGRLRPFPPLPGSRVLCSPQLSPASPARTDLALASAVCWGLSIPSATPPPTG